MRCKPRMQIERAKPQTHDSQHAAGSRTALPRAVPHKRRKAGEHIRQRCKDAARNRYRMTEKQCVRCEQRDPGAEQKLCEDVERRVERRPRREPAVDREEIFPELNEDERQCKHPDFNALRSTPYENCGNANAESGSKPEGPVEECLRCRPERNAGIGFGDHRDRSRRTVAGEHENDWFAGEEFVAYMVSRLARHTTQIEKVAGANSAAFRQRTRDDGIEAVEERRDRHRSERLAAEDVPLKGIRCPRTLGYGEKREENESVKKTRYQTDVRVDGEAKRRAKTQPNTKPPICAT